MCGSRVLVEMVALGRSDVVIYEHRVIVSPSMRNAPPAENVFRYKTELLYIIILQIYKVEKGALTSSSAFFQCVVSVSNAHVVNCIIIAVQVSSSGFG